MFLSYEDESVVDFPNSCPFCGAAIDSRNGGKQVIYNELFTREEHVRSGVCKNGHYVRLSVTKDFEGALVDDFVRVKRDYLEWLVNFVKESEKQNAND